LSVPRHRLAIVVIAAWLVSALPAPRFAPSARAQAQSSLSPQRAGDVFVTEDSQAQTWTIGNSELHVMFRLTAAKELVIEEISNPSTGRVLTALNEFDSAVTVNGNTLSPGAAAWGLAGVATSEEGSGVRLTFTFRSASVPVVAIRSYVCYPGSPTIETWTRFESNGAASATLSNEVVWRLAIPATTVHYVQGLRQTDGDVDQAFARRTATLGSADQMTLTEPNRSTESFLPMMTADAGADEFFGGLLWSGSWQIDLQGLGGGTRVTARLPRLSTTVDASHPHDTPHGFFGFTPGGQNAVSGALHEFVVQGLRGGRPFTPLVTYNTWFAYSTEIDEETLQGEIVEAAGLGVELFVVDAGWYAGAGKGMNFDTGLGSWQVDPVKFPSGLAALRDFAHSYGMRFGLWVEPERVDAATIGKPGLVREEWLAKNNGSYGAAKTPQVCLASPDARQWVFDELTRLLDDVQPDYLKWDNNQWVNCNRTGHGHGANDGNYAHVSSLYGLLADLRARYPDLLIEDCAQGGNRLDFGMLRYTDVAWMDDRTVPAVHVRHNLEGLITFFPPSSLLSFAASGLDEVLGASADLPLSMRSRMPGVLGLTYRAADLTEEDRDGIASEIAAYKRIRDTIRDASARLLTDQAVQDGPAWDAVQEVAVTTGNAIVLAFQNDSGTPRVAFQPEGLEAGATYLVTRGDGTFVGSASGDEIMAGGVEIDSSPESAAHLLFFEKQEAAPTSGVQSASPR
jgi:alpha-galactosidase